MNAIHLPGIDHTLAKTLILALAIHGVVLLTVDFESPQQSGSRLQSLEVTVVTQSTPEKPDSSDYFAQQNQAGGGDSEEAHKPTTSSALQGGRDIHTDDSNRSEFSPSLQTHQREERESPRLTVSRSTPITFNNSPADDSPTGEPNLPAALLANLSREITELEAELDDETEVLAKIGRRKTISAATREHIYADYMEMWRRRIEEVGNLNYPEGAVGSVVVHVAVRSDGSVEKTRILDPSTSSLVNESALSIARLAAPFQPFPDSVRSKTDILDIIRTWHFQQNVSGLKLNPQDETP